MILNYRDWANANATIGRLKSRLDKLRHRTGKYKNTSNFVFEANLVEKRILELSSQIEECNRLQTQSTTVCLPSRLSEIPDYLIRRRIRCGVTQLELANRLGFSRNAIGTYERTRFAGASLGRILQIDAAIQELESTREFELSFLLESEQTREINSL